MSTRGWEHATVQDTRDRRRPSKPIASKYRAVKTTVDGIVFHSKAEALRYADLLHRGIGGLIRNLELQPRFPIVLNGLAIATYVADFRYEERVGAEPFQPGYFNGWRDVVEDVKGFKTPMYRLKKKLVAAQYGIQIREVR